MLRTRPAGIVIIFVAALVSTSSAYLLATRAIVQADPVDAAANTASTTAPVPSLEDHEVAVRATLACLVAAGMIPITEPARGRLVTRINVDRQSLDLDTAEAAVARCRTESNLDAIERTRIRQMQNASITQEAAAREYFEDCLGGPGAGSPADDEFAACFDDTIAATGIPPLVLQR